MIITQYPYIDDNGIEYDKLIKFYSNLNIQIEQVETGRVFDSVVDSYPSSYNYTETDIAIEDSLSTMQEKAQAYDIIMGVGE